MNRTTQGPTVIIIRDGWGMNPNPEHDAFNAVKLASKPRCDDLLRRYPWALIHTSSEDVGLPMGTMGNSEVGHQNIGAGRIVDQDSVRITRTIRSGEFFQIPALKDAVLRAKARGGHVHLLGICSDAGVHGQLEHLYACLELCKLHGQTKVAVHCFTDGRDTGPYTGAEFIRQIESAIGRIGVGRIASVCGRYYAMDRDNRWERVSRAYFMLTKGDDPAVGHYPDAATAIKDYYDHPTNGSQEGDEFITPRTVGEDWKRTRIVDGDSVIFYNYRGDRPREITRAFVMPEFLGQVKASPDSGVKGFDRGPRLDLAYVCMTAYEEALNAWVQVPFPKPPRMNNIGGQWISGMGLRQFRCAETEKFPHVTFFFNDYREEPFPGEERAIIPSPKVPTYDLMPEMSAEGVAQATLDALDQGFDLLVVNFANGDMVGHTGKLDAAIKAVQTVDRLVGKIVDKTLAKGGRLIVTADHGNAEQMWDPTTNAPHTAHTLYDVECIVVDPRFEGKKSLKPDGRLADVVPTALALMGLPQPPEMTGRSLLPD